MWTPSKSAFLSTVCTRLVIVLIALFLVLAPRLVQQYILLADKDPAVRISLLITLYAVCVPALLAMFNLDRLLGSIRQQAVFIPANVARLRRISWCSFAVALIFAVSGTYYILFLIVAFMAAFFGLILRVVKNVIEQAVQLKQENDLTV